MNKPIVRAAFYSAIVILFSINAANGQTGDVGYRDFSYGPNTSSTPSASKPESKLWWNDGFWWGSLFSPTANRYRIHRLDLPTQSWVDTGTLLDPRTGSRADTLWDGQHLYVASHSYTGTSVATTDPALWARLYRYSYNNVTKTYSPDAGFPVNISRGRSEALVIDKDSMGRLWVTYVEGSKVMVNVSSGNDLTWGEPFVLPVSSTALTVDPDDISSVIAFQGNKIGVMWSNQLTSKMYFAVHLDGDPDNVWQMEQTAVPGPDNPDANADDHINLKSLQSDGSGRVFAAVKTSLTASNAPLIMLLVRDLSGNWSSKVFGRKVDHHTRPIVLLDEEHNQLYMFATSGESGGAIYYKSTDINNIQFSQGLGTPFIKTSQDVTINDGTSTKQNLNSATGLIVLASDQDTLTYLHNFISLNRVSVDDVTVSEGSGGTPSATFTVSLAARSAVPVTVDYSTADGTATAPGDYASTSGTLTIPAGSTSGTITVPLVGDTVVESSETFFVNLTNATNAGIARAQGVCNIDNDDNPPDLTINNVTLTEGNSGTKNFIFTVSLSVASGSPVTVAYSTADGTAVAPGDYTSASGTLSIPAGSSSGTITVPVIGDTVKEGDETFFVNLTSASNAIITGSQGLGTILSDDKPNLTINNVSTSEGSSGTKSFTFTVTISATTTAPVTVDYVAADGTATSPSDYTATTGTVTIPAGVRTATLIIPVVSDNAIEPDETFFVNLTNATNAIITDAQGLGTIKNDDTPNLTINNVSTTEGSSGAKTFTFTVSLSFAASADVTVNYATADDTAAAPSDYTSASGTVTIPAGVRTATITVSVIGDTAVEANETFFINLSNATNANITDAQGLGTIRNDDL